MALPAERSRRDDAVDKDVWLSFDTGMGTAGHLLWDADTKKWTIVIDQYEAERSTREMRSIEGKTIVYGTVGDRYAITDTVDYPYCVKYTNYRGESSVRFIDPKTLWWGGHRIPT